MPSDSYFALMRRCSSAQSSPSCNPCISIIQNRINREPSGHASVARAQDACTGGTDCKTVGAALATGGALRGFPNPAGRLPEFSFVTGRRGGKVPLPVRRFHQSVADRVRIARALSARRRPHFVAPLEARSQMGCRQKLRPVNLSESCELMDKLVGFAADGQTVERGAR